MGLSVAHRARLSLARRAMEPGQLLHLLLNRSPSENARHLKSRHRFVPAAQQFISLPDDDNSRSAALWADYRPSTELLEKTWRLLHPRHQHSLFWNGAVGNDRACLHKWGMAPSVACECGAEEQTVDHVVSLCPIHQLPHGLTVLDEETVEWLLDTCLYTQCGLAVD